MEATFTDRTLTCIDCGQQFNFSEGEQKYFWSKQLSEPKRCKHCRIIRKQTLVKEWKEGMKDGESTT